MSIQKTRLGLAIHQTASIPEPKNAAALAAMFGAVSLPTQLDALKSRANRLGQIEGMTEFIEHVEHQVKLAPEQGGFSHRAATWALLALLRTIELAETEHYIAAVVRDSKAQLGRAKGARERNARNAKLPDAEALKAEFNLRLAAGNSVAVAKKRLRDKYEVTAQALNSKLRSANQP